MNVKKGDFVRIPQAKCNGLVIEVFDDTRQKTITVLTEHGYFFEKLWEAHVKVINESR